MRIRSIFGVILGFLLLTATAAGSAQALVKSARTELMPSAGSIKIIHGEVYILRDGTRLPGAVGTAVQAKDVVHTGPDGSVGLILKDDTTLSLGPSSELVLKTFTFQPNEGLFAGLIGMVRGTLVYVSGRISKLSPGSVKLETPVGVVAVRGTKLLVKIAD